MLFHSTEAPAISRVPTRQEIPESDRWDLAHIYPDDSAWESEFTALQQRYPQITQFRGRLAESADTLLAALEFEKSIDQPLERLGTYGSAKMPPTPSSSNAKPACKISTPTSWSNARSSAPS